MRAFSGLSIHECNPYASHSPSCAQAACALRATLSHPQDKWSLLHGTMPDSFRLSDVTKKLLGSWASPSSGDTAPAEEYQALAATEEVPQQEATEEMGFQEQFEPPEGRSGDALAQVVAAVRAMH